MIFTDTHTHLYLSEFEPDRDEIIHRAIHQGIKYMFLPNIDSSSVESMLEICRKFSGNVFPMMGLHPTSVNENYLEEMKNVEDFLAHGKYYGLGECGIDLYWDKTFVKEQEFCFRRQIHLAHEYRLPLIIHSRESNEMILEILKDEKAFLNGGIFHCFSGDLNQAKEAIDLGFHLGIGGVVSFKNSGLADVVKSVPIESIVLETDAPFLAPVPYRGKRNESAYIRIIAEHIARIKKMELEEVASHTTKNALSLFDVDIH
ncbi:MAG: TatD family hydrolase [Bacteroidales bacterium]|nr:TatD family hydrolase [Bacteroidales bacterium]